MKKEGSGGEFKAVQERLRATIEKKIGSYEGAAQILAFEPEFSTVDRTTVWRWVNANTGLGKKRQYLLGRMRRALHYLQQGHQAPSQRTRRLIEKLQAIDSQLLDLRRKVRSVIKGFR